MSVEIQRTCDRCGIVDVRPSEADAPERWWEALPMSAAYAVIGQPNDVTMCQSCAAEFLRWLREGRTP